MASGRLTERRRPATTTTAVVLAALALAGCTGDDGGSPGAAGGRADPKLEARIRLFCGSCHRHPDPDVMPRHKWKDCVESMFTLAGGHPDLSVSRTVDYYVSRAPEELEWIPSHGARGVGRGSIPKFRVSGYRPVKTAPPTPAISHLRLERLFDDEPPGLLICDMRHGAILLQRVAAEGKPFQPLARVPHPARARVLDLDGDGHRDLLVSDLGSFAPSDHQRGRLLWLRGSAEKRFEPTTLLAGVGRVADADVADADGDGDLDIAVAIFGWRQTGKLVLLENLAETGSPATGEAPRYRMRLIDPRAGSMEVAFRDLDGDGRVDMLAIFAQHFEVVVAFLNRGALRFEPKVIHQAEHPNWGYSGMEIADLDGDGDLDVVAVNGDALDDGIPKPYHGVTWLRNDGAFPFAPVRLAALPGAHGVRTVDFDGDGDLDLFASAFLPHYPTETIRRPLATDALIRIEQVAPGRFESFLFESIKSDHVALEVADLEGDGDLDIVAGNFVLDPERQRETIPYWITTFQNLSN